jgi:hypothetical protein
MSYKVLHIRPCEQSFSPRTNSACKYGARLVKEENLSQGGCFLFGSRVQALCSAGLSLPPASSKNYQAACCSPSQSGFHRKVADKFDSTGATDCSKASSTDQRFGQPGIGGLADKKQSPWLSLKANKLSALHSNASMIATLGRSWRKFTGFWCPPGTIQSRQLQKS